MASNGTTKSRTRRLNNVRRNRQPCQDGIDSLAKNAFPDPGSENGHSSIVVYTVARYYLELPTLLPTPTMAILEMPTGKNVYMLMCQPQYATQAAPHGHPDNEFVQLVDEDQYRPSDLWDRILQLAQDS